MTDPDGSPAPSSSCALCGAGVEPEPHALLRWACPACGAPAVPSSARAGPLTARATASLRSARAAQASSGLWRTSALVTAGFGLLSVAVTAAVAHVAHPPLAPLLVGVAVDLAPLAFALVAWRNAGKRAAERAASLEEAWREAGR
jgi:hypothetical protein